MAAKTTRKAAAKSGNSDKGSKEAWRSEFQRLWTELVPTTGQATTVQGELVRAIGRLSDEAYRNGNYNFDKGHRIQCKYLRENLEDPTVFSETEIQEIDRWIDRVLDAKHPDLSGSTSPYYRLAERVVQWCKAKPEPIAHQLNPALHR
ncbi:hypothetical protein ACFPT7_05610 [Acidicapsa dinghuensis]|uniref:Core-binding (CB) domain-containing protein n=1 Tax=Acidicapsa dinghuensis TaxID=2218256 RepID=A0ABW1EET4_9BACT|nr:hypothetical protein [Acidicapsa dinghuensis]